MTRTQWLLGGLVAILLVAVFWVLLFQPQREEAAALQARAEDERSQQAMISAEIDRLRSVRQDAPEVEAELAATDAIVPREPALPSALRQLQLAADESGLVLTSVNASRPSEVADVSEPLHEIGVTVQLTGGYFQVVDFLRRVEDPTITPRGLVWDNASVTVQEYPELSIGLSGRLFAVITTPVPDEPEPADEAETDDDEMTDIDEEVDA
jgi:Tfp pilus assembly protein PilO